jgi:hypothetical protein
LAAVDKGEDMRKVTSGKGEREGVGDIKGVDNKGEVIGTQKVADRKVVKDMWVVVNW